MLFGGGLGRGSGWAGPDRRAHSSVRRWEAVPRKTASRAAAASCTTTWPCPASPAPSPSLLGHQTPTAVSLSVGAREGVAGSGAGLGQGPALCQAPGWGPSPHAASPPPGTGTGKPFGEGSRPVPSWRGWSPGTSCGQRQPCAWGLCGPWAVNQELSQKPHPWGGEQLWTKCRRRDARGKKGGHGGAHSFRDGRQGRDTWAEQGGEADLCLGDACAKAPGQDHAWCAEVVSSPVLDRREVVRSGR